jgi:ribonucleotide reductase beta subunit family protein with ferritin-like domain
MEVACREVACREVAEKEFVENIEEYRYTVLPIKRWSEWKAYKKAQESFWTEEEIDSELMKDPKDWKTLDDPIKHFIEYILAFFAVSDGIVNETLTEQIIGRIQTREIKLWYDFQIMMEDIHNIVYSKLIDVYFEDEIKKNQVFKAMENYPAIKRKIKWVRKWLGKDNELHQLSAKTMQSVKQLISDEQDDSSFDLDRSQDSQNSQNSQNSQSLRIEVFFEKLHKPQPTLALQVLINTIMEGVFFSGSFCAIYWIFSTTGKLPGLSKANEFISRDEGMHTDFGIHLYKSFKHQLSQSMVHSIINEAVDIESDFINDALPGGLLGMNATLMTQYIKFVADQLLSDLGYEIYFHEDNPFPFMNKQSTSVRIGDFFTDGSITEYGHHSSGISAEDQLLDFSEF